MYAEEEDYNRCFVVFEKKYKDSFGTFVDYFIGTWHNRRQFWARPWRRDASFDTNILIESYHNQLKSNYFGRSRNTRFDRIVYLLSQVVIVDYRQDALRVQTYLSCLPSKNNTIFCKKTCYMIITTMLLNCSLMIIISYKNHKNSSTPTLELLKKWPLSSTSLKLIAIVQMM